MPLGTHVLVELFDCNIKYLENTDTIEKIMLRAVDISGATLIKPFFHQFSPHGVSGICVVAESHFAIHTWPEHGYAAIDFFSCGEFDYMKAMKLISDRLEAGEMTASLVERGNIEAGKKGSPLELKELKETVCT